MPKKRLYSGVIDPITIIGVLFLIITLSVGTFVVADKKYDFNIFEYARNPKPIDGEDGIDRWVDPNPKVKNPGGNNKPIDNRLEEEEVEYIQDVITAPVVINNQVVNQNTEINPVQEIPETVTPPVTPVINAPPPVTTQPKTCRGKSQDYAVGAVVVGGVTSEDGIKNGYGKCTEGGWTADCDPNPNIIKLCTITDLTPNLAEVPVYLQPQYQAAMEQQAKINFNQLEDPEAEHIQTVIDAETKTQAAVQTTTTKKTPKTLCLETEGNAWVNNSCVSNTSSTNAFAGITAGSGATVNPITPSTLISNLFQFESLPTLDQSFGAGSIFENSQMSLGGQQPMVVPPNEILFSKDPNALTDFYKGAAISAGAGAVVAAAVPAISTVASVGLPTAALMASNTISAATPVISALTVTGLTVGAADCQFGFADGRWCKTAADTLFQGYSLSPEATMQMFQQAGRVYQDTFAVLSSIQRVPVIKTPLLDGFEAPIQLNDITVKTNGVILEGSFMDDIAIAINPQTALAVIPNQFSLTAPVSTNNALNAMVTNMLLGSSNSVLNTSAALNLTAVGGLNFGSIPPSNPLNLASNISDQILSPANQVGTASNGQGLMFGSVFDPRTNFVDVGISPNDPVRYTWAPLGGASAQDPNPAVIAIRDFADAVGINSMFLTPQTVIPNNPISDFLYGNPLPNTLDTANIPPTFLGKVQNGFVNLAETMLFPPKPNPLITDSIPAIGENIVSQTGGGQFKIDLPVLQQNITNWIGNTVGNNPIVNRIIGRPEDISLIPEETIIQIGKDHQKDFFGGMFDRQVSPDQGEIILRDNKIIYKDTGSKNGSYYKYQPNDNWVRLSPNEEIVLYPSRATIEIRPGTGEYSMPFFVHPDGNGNILITGLGLKDPVVLSNQGLIIKPSLSDKISAVWKDNVSTPFRIFITDLTGFSTKPTEIDLSEFTLVNPRSSLLDVSPEVHKILYEAEAKDITVYTLPINKLSKGSTDGTSVGYSGSGVTAGRANFPKPRSITIAEEVLHDPRYPIEEKVRVIAHEIGHIDGPQTNYSVDGKFIYKLERIINEILAERSASLALTRIGVSTPKGFPASINRFVDTYKRYTGRNPWLVIDAVLGVFKSPTTDIDTIYNLIALLEHRKSVVSSYPDLPKFMVINDETIDILLKYGIDTRNMPATELDVIIKALNNDLENIKLNPDVIPVEIQPINQPQTSLSPSAGVLDGVKNWLEGIDIIKIIDSAPIPNYIKRAIKGTELVGNNDGLGGNSPAGNLTIKEIDNIVSTSPNYVKPETAQEIYSYFIQNPYSKNITDITDSLITDAYKITYRDIDYVLKYSNRSPESKIEFKINNLNGQRLMAEHGLNNNSTPATVIDTPDGPVHIQKYLEGTLFMYLPIDEQELIIKTLNDHNLTIMDPKLNIIKPEGEPWQIFDHEFISTVSTTPPTLFDKIKNISTQITDLWYEKGPANWLGGNSPAKDPGLPDDSANLPTLHNPPNGLQIKGVLPSSLDESGESIGTTSIILDAINEGKRVVIKKAINNAGVKSIKRELAFLENKGLPTTSDIPIPKHTNEVKIKSDGIDVTARFVRLEPNSMSDDMIANSEIALEYIEGQKIRTLTDTEKLAALSAYFKLESTIADEIGYHLDTRMLEDVLVKNLDDGSLEVIRLDPVIDMFSKGIYEDSYVESIKSELLELIVFNNVNDNTKKILISIFHKHDLLPKDEKTVNNFYKIFDEHINPTGSNSGPTTSTKKWTLFPKSKDSSGQVFSGLAPVLGIVPVGIYYVDQYFDLRLFDNIKDALSDNSVAKSLGVAVNSGNFPILKPLAPILPLPNTGFENIDYEPVLDQPANTTELEIKSEDLTSYGQGECTRSGNNDYCDGTRMYELYLWYKNQPDGWWQKDGNLTPAEFLAMMLIAESTGGDPELLKSIMVATSNQLWGQSDKHDPYCTTVECEAGIFNFLGDYVQSAGERYNGLISNEGNPSQGTLRNLASGEEVAKYFAKNGLSIDQIANDVIYNPISSEYNNDAPTQWGVTGCGENCEGIEIEWLRNLNNTNGVEYNTTDRCGIYDSYGLGNVQAVVYTNNQMYNWSLENSPCTN